MGLEIERKFLVEGEAWRAEVTGAGAIRQNYLARGQGLSVRVRTKSERAWLTVKAGMDALARHEFEYEVPLADAEAMLALCPGPAIEKVRHLVPAANGLVWEVDAFEGKLAGLVLAEIELPSADTPFARPAWLGREVTDDPSYLNSNLHLRFA
ncbi:MAG TPA: CYTH domain-containing protein [Allosphingosinicella sp.]|nr:CYTH domain-containing protein [Allosphingosinicella sp.]